MLDRLLGHDAWTTQLLLLRCAELPDSQLDQVFDVDQGSVRALLAHMIGNVEIWTDLVEGRPPRPKPPPQPSIAELADCHTAASEAFGTLSRHLHAAGRLNETWLDTLDDPPTSKTYGGAILHVITHNMHHRAHLLLILGWLGLTGLPEGNVLGWETRL